MPLSKEIRDLKISNYRSPGRFFSFFNFQVVWALNYHILLEFWLGSQIKLASLSGSLCTVGTKKRPPLYVTTSPWQKHFPTSKKHKKLASWERGNVANPTPRLECKGDAAVGKHFLPHHSSYRGIYFGLGELLDEKASERAGPLGSRSARKTSIQTFVQGGWREWSWECT